MQRWVKKLKMLAKTGCKREDEAKKKYLKHSKEKSHQPIGIVMIYDDCDEMVAMVGGGAEPEDNGEDADKILSHCLELYKSGGQCWAGSDPEPRTWSKKYVNITSP